MLFLSKRFNEIKFPETEADLATKTGEAHTAVEVTATIEITQEIETVDDVPDLEVWRDGEREEIVIETAGVAIEIVEIEVIDEIGILEIEDLGLMREKGKEAGVGLTGNHHENVETLETRDQLVL